MVVKTAVLGKAGAGEGDTLDDPTTRLEYDVHAFVTSGGTQPAFVHVFAREQHGAANPRWQESYTYFDGFGCEVMKKVQAEGNRWVGTGRTVFDNKGNPVKKYEPFFSATPAFESEEALVGWGVTPILRYDPLGRLVRTDLPNGTFTSIVFDAWQQATWDENDNVAGTPWLTHKQAGGLREQRGASLALEHAGTPTVAKLDALGRTFLTVADNGPKGLRATRVGLDVAGNQLAVTDARGNLIQRQRFDLLARPLRTVRADAGAWDAGLKRRAVPVQTDPDGARTLLDAADKPVRAWLERGFVVRTGYDALQRPTHLFVREPGGSSEALVQRTVYGESLPLADAQARNLRLQVCEGFDGAGVVENLLFDFKGNLLSSQRKVTRSVPGAGAPSGWAPFRPDWTFLDSLGTVAAIDAAAAPVLDAAYATAATYDALNRVTSKTTPDGSVTRPTYNEANLLERVDVRLRGAVAWTPFVTSVEYNARGQRLSVEQGAASGGSPATRTTYEYDEETFRLIRLRTVRLSDSFLLQDLAYEHDPVGNLVQLTDRVSFGRAASAPTVAPEASLAQRLAAGYGDGAYVYDALYQLVEAQGRHHPGQQPDDSDAALGTFAHPNDAQALEGYRETYDYDPAGNLLQMANRPLVGSGGWTRNYAYAPDSNRLLGTSVPSDPAGVLSATYDHDEAGNLSRMPHLPGMTWDYANRLSSVVKQVGLPTNEVTFVYDASGERIRKVYTHGGLIEERLYLGGYEVYRKRSGTSAPDLERHTLHVMDDRRRIALVETKTVDASVPAFTATTRQRFQVENHLGSAAMEMDEAGAVIGYEEFYPFGNASFRAAASASDVSAKRYRYTGKERDEETGLDYFGARYYAPWLGRWASCDPAGFVDGTDLFVYVRNNPIGFIDPTGTEVDSPKVVNPEIVVPGKFKGNESQDDVRSKYAEAGYFYEGDATWVEKTKSWWVDRSQLIAPSRDEINESTPSEDRPIETEKNVSADGNALDSVGNASRGVAMDRMLPQQYRLEPARGATVTGVRDTLGGKIRGNPPKPVGEPVVRVDKPHGGTPYPHVNVESLGAADPHARISPGMLKALGGTARTLEAAGRIAMPLAIATDTIRIGLAIQEDGGIGHQTTLTAASVAGGWAGAAVGAWAGAKGGALLGGALGSLIPGLGTVAGAAIGGLVGGLLGGIGGAFVGSWGAKRITEKLR